MEAILFIAGCLLGFGTGFIVSKHAHAQLVKKWFVGKLKIVWDREEHQPYMFMQLTNPDVTDVINRKYVLLDVDNEIDFTQK